MFMSRSNVHKGFCHITTLLWVMLDCDVPQWLWCIAMFIFVYLCLIATFLIGNVSLLHFFKDYVALQHSSSGLMDYDIPQCLMHIVMFILVELCQIATFINGYVAF
jgi:hypothetical protein